MNFKTDLSLFVVLTLLPLNGFLSYAHQLINSSYQSSVLVDRLIISSGNSHTCAVTTSQTLQCWGGNYAGQLGIGTTKDQLIPVQVSALMTDVIALSTNVQNTCALVSSGHVKCWGGNGNGQVGSGTFGNTQISPVDVQGLSDTVTFISTGYSHSCAVTKTGAAQCWGENFEGQLGDGSTAMWQPPVQVSGLITGVIAVAAGGQHSCALLVSMRVKCWGNNTHGQLGDGTMTRQLTPVDVIGLPDDIVSISAGEWHNCAVTASGGLKCWGRNYVGQLGDGTTIDRTTPVDVLGLTSETQSVSAGFNFTCALTKSSIAKCWGYNGYGQLGDGTTSDRLTPIVVSAIPTNVLTISAGFYHTCAQFALGIKCWGSNAFGQLGDGSTISHTAPANVLLLSIDLPLVIRSTSE